MLSNFLLSWIGSLGAVAVAAIEDGSETQFDTSNMGASTVDHDDGAGKTTRMLRVRDFDTVDSVTSELEEIMALEWKTLLPNSPSIRLYISPRFNEKERSMKTPGPINAIQCYGTECEIKSLIYFGSTSHTIISSHNYYTNWFSEEDRHQEDCQDNYVVTQILCGGKKNCDNMKLQCSSLVGGYSLENAVSMKTNQYSSKEKKVPCYSGYYVTGVECYKSNCAEIALHCTRMKYFVQGLNY